MGFSPSEADEFENDAIAMGTHFTLTGQGSGAELEARGQLAEYDSEYEEYILDGADTRWYIVGDDPESTHLQGVPAHEVAEFEDGVMGWGISYTLIGQGQGAEQEARDQLDEWIGDYKVCYSLYGTNPTPDVPKSDPKNETNVAERFQSLEINSLDFQPKPLGHTPSLNGQDTESLTAPPLGRTPSLNGQDTEAMPNPLGRTPSLNGQDTETMPNQASSAYKENEARRSSREGAQNTELDNTTKL